MTAPTMVIVGAGLAGWSAARSLRRSGHEGPIVLLGAEPYPTYERPPLSKAYLAGDRDLAAIVMAKPEAIEAARVDFRPSARVVAIDRAGSRVVLADGGHVAYDRLLLATGREPRHLRWPEVDPQRVHVLRDVADADRLRAAIRPGLRLLVIGGGFIGLEVAATARRLGAAPVVIEALPRLMGRAVPEAVAAFVLDRHRAAGVEVLLGHRVAAMREGPEGIVATFDDGTTRTGEAVVVGIGAVPRIELAAAADLEVADGIVVDPRLRTSDPLIFAAGDVAAVRDPATDALTLRETWRNAELQGTLAGRNMLGHDEPLGDAAWFWSDQHDLSIQVAGLPERAVRVVERPLGAEHRLFFHLDAAGRIVAASGAGAGGFGREMTLARMLVDRGIAADPAVLAGGASNLRALLR